MPAPRRPLATPLAVVLLAAASFAGCVTEGRDFNSDTTWIKEGRTSQKDVKGLLKEPYSVGNSAGKPTWTYGYYHYKLIGKGSQKELKFYWNPDGTVNTYSFSSTFSEDVGGQSGGTPEKGEF